MLRFCGQFGSAHRSSAQFSNTYKARPICIVCPKQPFVLLVKVWFTYPVRSIQFTHSSPIVHIQFACIVHPHTRGYHKNCEQFYFRLFFAGAKTPLQRFRWLKKYTLNRCFLSYKRHNASALSTNCYISRGGVRFCCFSLSRSLFNIY